MNRVHTRIGAKHNSSGSRRRRLLYATLALLATSAASASAELTQKGNLFIRFDGGISPIALPRQALAPIGVRIQGTIRVPPGDVPPNLRRIRIALNRAGRLSTRGLPTCPRRRISSATSSRALAVCGPALVGAGGLVANTSFKDQSRSIVRGELLFFNAVANGRRLILAHLFERHPAPVIDIIEFRIRHQRGTFGTVLTGRVPPKLNRNGYLKSIFLKLQRTYSFRGHRRSYLSAACAAPRGFPGAAFPFAHASMTFDDGRSLFSTLVRTCKVRR